MPERVLATSDCERCRPGLVSQPANAASSVAYVVAGAAMLRGARRAGPGRSTESALAWATVAAGVGSVAYHGPGGTLGRYAHDAGIVALLGFHALSDAEHLAGRRIPAGLAVVPLAAAVGATPRRSSATQALAGVAAIAAGAARQRWGDRPTRRADQRVRDDGTDLSARRSSDHQAVPTDRPAIGSGAAAQAGHEEGDLSAAVPTDPAAVAPGGPGWSRWIAGPALAVGLAAQGLGRTGGPWCRPDSLLQPHALWHVLTAGALWARSRRTAR